MFNRAPTDAEAAFYNSFYLQGQSDAGENASPLSILFETEILQWFVNSGEFQKLSDGWTVQQYTTWLYNNALLRTPSATELAYYANSGCTWAQIAGFITQSQESISKLGYA